MKLSLALAGTALLAATLTACGGSSGGNASDTGGSGSDYCKDLKDSVGKVGSIKNPDVSKLDDAFTQFHRLAAEAPGSIKGDWKTVDDAIVSVQKAFADAGLKISDLSKLKPGSTPGLDASKIASLVAQLKKLNTAEFSKASKAIESHAKTTCNVTLR